MGSEMCIRDRAGIGIAAFFYLRKTDLPHRMGQAFATAYKVLWNKYYVDELYHHIVVRPSLWMADRFITDITDGKIIEGIVNGVPAAIGNLSGRLRRAQTGIVQEYGAVMLIGVFIIITLVLLW